MGAAMELRDDFDGARCDGCEPEPGRREPPASRLGGDPRWQAPLGRRAACARRPAHRPRPGAPLRRRGPGGASRPQGARSRGTSARNGACPRAIRPAMGEAAGLVMPWADTHAMGLHPAEISRAVDPGAHAVVILDQAGRRMSRVTSPPDPGLGGKVPRGRRMRDERGTAPSFHDGVQGAGRRAPIGAGRQAGQRGQGAGGRIFAARRLAARAGGGVFGRGCPASEARGGGACRAEARESRPKEDAEMMRKASALFAQRAAKR